ALIETMSMRFHTRSAWGPSMYDPKRGYPAVVPCVIYDDFSVVVPWLTQTLGFRETVRATLPDGWSGHVELERDGFVILLGRRGGQFEDCRSIVQIYVDDVHTRCEAAVTAGGALLAEPTEQPWGSAKPSSQTRKVNAGSSPSTSATSTPPSGRGKVLGPIPG
ncbi:MAG: VOC family protein, partial [Sciscionella sp.]